MKTEIQQRLAHLRHVAFDLDGTIYLDGQLFPPVRGLLSTLAELGIGYSFLTNNSSRGKQHYVQLLEELGIATMEENIFTSTDATIEFLRDKQPMTKRLFVLGTKEMRDELVGQGFETTSLDPDDEPDAVVVGFDSELQWKTLCCAAYWIDQQKPFIATNIDRVCPTKERTVMVDCGSICAAIESATGRKPDVVPGKPDPRMINGLMRRYGVDSSQVAMVGDRLYTDMAMARAADVLGILVLTGEATEAQVAQCDSPPDLVLRDLREFEDLLRNR